MLCLTVNVVVGFLYILNVCLLSVFVMVRSRKFMLLLTSVSKVKFNFRCSLLMFWCNCFSLSAVAARTSTNFTEN